MRLSEPITESGYFWLPEQPDTKLPGTLQISNGGKVKLDVIGLLKEPFAAAFQPGPFERMVGVIKNSMVTLDNCYYIPGTIHFGGICNSIIKAQFAYVGVGYEKNEPINFTKLDFSVEGLDEWLSITGIKIEHDWEARSGKINYSPPKEISIQLPDGISLVFTFGWTLPGGVKITEAKITQKAYISLRSSNPRRIKDLRTLVFKITNFLCFAIDKTVSLDSVTAYSDDLTEQTGEGQKRKIPIEVYYESMPVSETKPRISWHNMLFQYRHIAQELEKVIGNWLANYETSEPAFNLYFASQSGAHRYIEGRFLSLAQGIETLHRRNSDKTLMPKEEFTELVDALIEACSDDKRKWLKGRLAYGNELSLRQRLTEMIDPFQHLYGSPSEAKNFVSRVIDTRNYFTHYDQKPSQKVTDGIGLWNLCMKLEALFQLHFLRLMGLDIQYINNLLNQNYAMKEKLKN